MSAAVSSTADSSAKRSNIKTTAANATSISVAGTNRTLNQQVVFTWNFIAPTNAPGQSPTPALGVLNQSSLNNTQQFPGLYNNSGIIGRAQINSGKEIEVRATPVGP